MKWKLGDLEMNEIEDNAGDTKLQVWAPKWVGVCSERGN